MATDRLINQTQGDSIITALQAISGNQATSAQVAAIVAALQTMAQNVGGSVKSINGILPNSAGAITLPYAISNKNILDNSDFRNPVNQLGQSSYACSGKAVYTVDRWYITESTSLFPGTTLTVNDGYVTLGGPNELSGYGYPMKQRLESALPSGTYTFSALVETESSSRAAVVIRNSSGTSLQAAFSTQAGPRLVSVTYTGADAEVFEISTRATACKVYAAKLECGGTQTLAHQENDTWVLNELPDYGMQLAKCQRHMFCLQTSATLYVLGSGHMFSSASARILIPTPVTMRAKPTAIPPGGNFTNLRVNSAGSQFTPSDTASNTNLARNGVMIYLTVSGGTQYAPASLTAGATGSLVLDANLEPV